MKKVIVSYNHDSRVVTPIYLALAYGKQHPSDDDWVPAYRDTIEGEKVVWAKFYSKEGNLTVWLRDNSGDKAVKSIRMQGVNNDKSRV